MKLNMMINPINKNNAQKYLTKLNEILKDYPENHKNIDKRIMRNLILEDIKTLKELC